MALIDQSYFVGDLTIAGLDRPAVQQRLNLFIDKYEDEFLRNLLGHPLYTAFLNGLSAVTVDHKWLDLLQGKEYQYGGRTRQWRGLVILPPGQTISLSPAGRLDLVAGGQGANDPVVGEFTIALPAQFVNTYFTIERRGIGELRTDEYSVTGNTLTLVGQPAWNISETIILKKSVSVLSAGAGSTYLSPIANYVYWYWMTDDTTQTVGLGQQASKVENAIQVSPATKMVRAWNEMNEWVAEFHRFMITTQADYPEWTQANHNYSKFAKTNVFGI
jgi:hypothetical protein